jgi:hypothetical protein
MPPGAAPGAPDDAGDGYDYAAQLEREPARARDARAAFKHALPLLALTLVALAALALDAASVARDRARGFSKFFSSIDDDRDGELTLGELAEYLGTARLGVAGSDAATTARRLDSPDDDDTTVSLRELRRGAGLMKSVRETAEWVRWGVGAPECANAFAENGVSSMDFPSLLAKDGERLRRMGVVRDHEKLTRAMTRQLLHVGRAPSSPRAVKASVERGDGEPRVRVTWRAPKDLGSPRAHEYVVQSGVGVGGRVLKWTHVANVDSETFTVDVDELSRAPGVRHKFRVIAWGEYGRSKSTKAMSNWVTIADESDAKWVGTIVSLALTLRFVIAARGLIIRGLVLMAALVKFTVALAKGEKKSVKEFLEPALRMKEPSTPPSVGISINRKLFTPTKVLESQSSMSESDPYFVAVGDACMSMESRKQLARKHLDEREFAAGAGGSDGFSPVHQSIVSRHAREAMTLAPNDSLNGRRREPGVKVLACSDPGCQVNLKKARTVRHFCGLCQAWFCAEHTRVSPHGNRGRCKPESRCICTDCYEILSKEEQRELDEDNAYSIASRTTKKKTLSRAVTMMMTRRRGAKASEISNNLFKDAMSA